MMIKKRKTITAIAVFFIVHFTSIVLSAPYHGEIFRLKQPDMSSVPVKVWGDEYYQRVESVDGYTLIRDSKGWICYARLTEDRSDFIATEHIYNGKKLTRNLLSVPKGLKLSVEARYQKAKSNKQLMYSEKRKSRDSEFKIADRILTGDTIKGLTLLIEFSDEPATVSYQEIENFINQKGYSGFNNNGSVYDYFFDISNGKLNYRNMVTGYYTAKYPKSYYNDASVNYTVRTKELIMEALQALDNKGFDFSVLSTDGNNRILAINTLYTGDPDVGWAQGLWPHQGYLTSFEADGVTSRKYQITSLGSSLSIGTFCHENGHLICGLPDLYDYTGDSRGVGKYCLMANGGGKNPVPINAYFRHYCGWENVTDISSAVRGTLFYHTANSSTSFLFRNPSDINEAFYIESRVKKGRNVQLPDEGLLIWHIDANGSNNNQQMTAESHYLVSVEQADNLYELENNINTGNSGDLFHAGNKEIFSDATSPGARWWDGTYSGLEIFDISAVADTMSFIWGGHQNVAVNEKSIISKDTKKMSIHSDRVSKRIRFQFTDTENVKDIAIYNLHGSLLYHIQDISENIVWEYKTTKGIYVGKGVYIGIIKIGNTSGILQIYTVKLNVL